MRVLWEKFGIIIPSTKFFAKRSKFEIGLQQILKVIQYKLVADVLHNFATAIDILFKRKFFPNSEEWDGNMQQCLILTA